MFREIPFAAYPSRSTQEAVPGARTDVDESVAKRIWDLENSIRRFVVSELSAVSSTWWEERVSREIGSGAELRRRNELESALGGVALHPIAYLSLGELFDVVLSQKNWNEVFAVRLTSSDTALRELSSSVTTVRNRYSLP